jgi:hypothetical protein
MIFNANDLVTYGITTNSTDIGVGMNNLWTHINDGDTVNMAPGNYTVATPIVWTNKSFTLNAVAVGWTWHGENTAHTVFTIGNADNICITGLNIGIYWTYANYQCNGILLQNANNCMLDRLTLYSFAVAITNTGTSSNNVIRDLTVVSPTIIKQTGSAAGLKIINCDASGPETPHVFFDLSAGGGYNHIIMATLQTEANDFYLLKGTHDEIMHLKYYEGHAPYPYKARIQWNDNNTLISLDGTNLQQIGNEGGNYPQGGYHASYIRVNTLGWTATNPWHGPELIIEDLGNNNNHLCAGLKQCQLPGTLTVTNVTTNSITVTYAASVNSNGPYKYDWMKSADNNGMVADWHIVASQQNAQSPASYTYTGLTPNTKYWFWIRVGDVDNIPYSDAYCISAVTT